MILKVTIYK